MLWGCLGFQYGHLGVLYLWGDSDGSILSVCVPLEKSDGTGRMSELEG